MHLSGPGGQSFALRIVGYEFPHLVTKYYDANWLIVEGQVTHASGSWTFTHPSLLTDEVGALIEWLLSMSEGSAIPTELNFLEPNLAFELVQRSDGSYLLVHFELEARPPWTESRRRHEEDFYVAFPLDAEQLSAAAKSLREQLEVLPTRLAR